MKLNHQNQKIVHMSLNLSKAVVVFILGSLSVHIIVMLIDYYFMIKPIALNLHRNFVSSIFSAPMLPMMAAYGLFSLALFFLWQKTQKAMLHAREKEIQSEKVQDVLASMQRLTGIVAEHIAVHNTDIINWIEFRKRRGKPVSCHVEGPSGNIAAALHTLSEVAFVIPYTEMRPVDVSAVEHMLAYKLDQVARSAEKQ